MFIDSTASHNSPSVGGPCPDLACNERHLHGPPMEGGIYALVFYKHGPPAEAVAAFSGGNVQTPGGAFGGHTNDYGPASLDRRAPARGNRTKDRAAATALRTVQTIANQSPNRV